MATDKLLVLITGANAGLGYYAVQQMSATNKYHILLAARSLSKAQAAIASLKADTSGNANVENLEPIEIDVTSDPSIAAAANYVQVKYGYLDILMNNAGISRSPPRADGSTPTLREDYQLQYNTNVFGPAITVDTFLPLLRKSTKTGGKRIMFTGSETGSLDETWKATKAKSETMRGRLYPIYRSTKTALNMVLTSYTDLLEDEGFIVSAACPGYCATNLNDHRGFKDPREGAKNIIAAIEGKKEDVHGRLSNEKGPIGW